MEIKIPASLSADRIRGYLHDPLYRNSLYLSLGRYVDVGAGFFFWIFAARLYSITDVGIATALISSLGIVIAFARLGLDTSIIRFMPIYDHDRVYNSSLGITLIAAVIGGLIYPFIIGFISPELAFIKDYVGIFLIIVIANAITLTTGYAFLAVRRADRRFVQNLITSSRLLFLFPFVALGALGIFYSYGLVFALGSVYALLIIRKHVRLTFRIDLKFVRETFHFTFYNYISFLLEFIPTAILPIIIVEILSPADAALYYIAYAIGNLVLIIPNAMGTSFFIEGCHGMNLRKGVYRALRTNYAILIPAILFLFFFGDLLLSFFGTDYAGAFDLLRIIAISSLAVTIHNLFIPYLNIRHRVREVFIISLARFVLLTGLSYILLLRYGLMGAGYAWAITYLVIGFGIAAYVKYEGLV